MESVLEYRINDHADQLKSLRENSHKVNATLLKQSATLDKIMEAADQTYEKACENSNRVDTIEKRIAHDDAVKETKSKILKSFFDHWKIIIIVAFIVVDLTLHGFNIIESGKSPYLLGIIKNL